jgi:polar amino acid transport system substrate-binding protein
MGGKTKGLWLLLFILFSTTTNAASPLRIAYPAFAPFHYTDVNGVLRGFFYDIITEAVQRRMGVQMIWTPYPWTRCQENVKNGQEDAFLTVPTPERAVYTKTHPKPFYEKTLHLFTYQNHPKIDNILQIKSIADIKKNDFSVITYSGNGWHKKNVASLGIPSYETSDIVNVWHMLALKRGDLVIEWPAAAIPDIRAAGRKEQLVDTGVVVDSMPFHLLIRTGSIHIDILDTFDATIEAMEKDGTMRAILESIH